MSAPLIVAALFGPDDQARFDRLRGTHFPAERNHLPAHLTLFHHLPPSLLAELKQRLSAETRGVAAPAARAAGVINRGRGVAIRIESAGLEVIRARLADAFDPLLTPQDSAGWRPHVTVQNKVMPEVAKATLAALSADFEARPVRIAGIGVFYYRGGPWEPVSRHMF